MPPLAEVLIGLIGEEAKLIAEQSAALNSEGIPQTQSADLEMWEHHIEATIESDSLITDTDRKALIVARRGQGLFKQRVMQIENRCLVTGVNNPVHLVGSHCKPWRDSSNEERLDGENGLLLTPTIDHLFDRGFIGFENSGELIVSPVAHALR
jgi:putative restriction endonuclease